MMNIMLEITRDFIPVGNKNRPGRVNPIQFIAVHDTGNYDKGADAKAHAEYLKNPKTKESWHFTVDDKSIYQHLPVGEDALHAGDGAGSGNRQSLGVEICVNSDGDLKKATDNTVELIALLCKNAGLTINEVYQHNAFNGKNCPAEIRKGNPYNWDVFISKIKSRMYELSNIVVDNNKLEFMEVTQTVININGQLRTVDRILKDGFNYIRLRDLESDNIKIGYDEENKLPIITTI